MALSKLKDGIVGFSISNIISRASPSVILPYSYTFVNYTDVLYIAP